eukprot:g5024.t1
MKLSFTGRAPEGSFPGIILTVSKRAAEEVENGTLNSVEAHKDDYSNLRRVSPDSAVFLYAKDGVGPSSLKGIFQFPSEPQLDLSNESDEEITRCSILQTRQLPELTDTEFRMVASSLFFSNTEFYSDISVFHITLFEDEMKNKGSNNRTGLQQFPFHPYGYQYMRPPMMWGNSHYTMHPEMQRVVDVADAQRRASSSAVTDTGRMMSVAIQTAETTTASSSNELINQQLRAQLQDLETQNQQLTVENERLREETRKAKSTFFTQMHSAAGLDSNDANPVEEELQEAPEFLSPRAVSSPKPSFSSHHSSLNQSEVVPEIPQTSVFMTHQFYPPLPSPVPAPPANMMMPNPRPLSPRMAAPESSPYYPGSNPNYYGNTPVVPPMVTTGAGSSSHRSGVASQSLQSTLFSYPEWQLAVIGGKVGSEYVNEIEVYDPTISSWTNLVQFPENMTFAYGSAEAIGNNLFLIGGLKERNEIVNNMQKLDLQTHQLEDLGPMKIPRCGVVSVKVGDHIFLLGERNRCGRQVEIFDPQTRQWTRLPHMKKERMHHDAAVSVERHAIYVFGGKGSNPSDEVSVEHHDAREGRWHELARMERKRQSCCGAIIDDCLYVVGGLLYEGNTRSVTNTVRVFDLKMNRWRSGPDFDRRRYDARAIAFNRNLYVIGGLDDNDIPCGLNVLNVSTNVWQGGSPAGSRYTSRVHHSVVVLPPY